MKNGILAITIGLFSNLAAQATEVSSVAKLAESATVRIKHYRGKYVSIGYGVVIARDGKDAIIATCAHVFQSGNGPFDVQVVFFTDDGSNLIRRGKSISFDRHLDVGLLRVSGAPKTCIVPLAQRIRKPLTHESVIIVTDDVVPRAFATKITGIDRFVTRPNIVVKAMTKEGDSGAPLVGRDGYLLGVCNGIDPEVNEGLYASAEAFHQLIESGHRVVEKSYRSQQTSPSHSTIEASHTLGYYEGISRTHQQRRNNAKKIQTLERRH